MKTIGKFLLCMACMALLANCAKDPTEPAVKDGSKMDIYGSYSFIVDYRVTDNTLSDKTVLFDGINGVQRKWLGSGENELLGMFNVEITFLCFIKPGELCGEFCNMKGTFQAQDGSTLIFDIAAGEVIMNTDENCNTYQTCFNNPAIIKGGTGKFAGATGYFLPQAFIHNGQDQFYADFFNRGYLSTRSYPIHEENEF